MNAYPHFTPSTEMVRAGWSKSSLASAQLRRQDEFDRWLAAHDAEILAAHQVTLVADSREALATGLDESAQWEDPSDPYDAADALIASGVVQVTTPTEVHAPVLAAVETRVNARAKALFSRGVYMAVDAVPLHIQGLLREAIAHVSGTVVPPPLKEHDGLAQPVREP